MIRINLLPEAKRGAVATGGSSQLWAVVYLLSCFAWGVVLFLVYLNYNSVLEEQAAKNTELQGQIERAKSQSENIGEVEAQLAKSKQLEEVVTALQSARQGPARVLMELSKILSEGGGPSLPSEELEALRRDNPLGAYNPGWDVRRLWIDSFVETKRKCTIGGFGKSNEDVAEFLRRLNVSEVFDQVKLQATTSASDPAGGTPIVRFTLSCEVRY
jgi:type IV pilus assembly protein PilN